MHRDKERKEQGIPMSEENDKSQTKEIYKAIIGITEDLIKEGGIGKTRMNEQQKFWFRGIEDIQNALAPLLVKHQVCIIPTFANRRTDQYLSRNGGKIFSTVVEGVFDLVSAKDGSRVRVTIPGEAMDTGDKSTNKAMSMAMKYASLLTFCIPTVGEDADAIAHDLKGAPDTDPETGPTGASNGAKTAQPKTPPAGVPPFERPLTKVVRVNGKRVRTAGIEADQLSAIWDAVGRSGKEKVTQALKAFGVEKSVYLLEKEAQQVLARLDQAVGQPQEKVQ
jgi:hypothetical protein